MKQFCIAVLCLLMSGCAGLVCRHNVMADAAWAEEQGLEYEIVIYEIAPLWSFGKYDAHAQVKTNKGWISSFLGQLSLSATRTYPLNGWEKGYDFDTYMALMRRNCFNYADCRDEGIPY